MQIKMVQTKHLKTHLSSLLAHSHMIICSTASTPEGAGPLQVAPAKNNKTKQKPERSPDKKCLCLGIWWESWRPREAHKFVPGHQQTAGIFGARFFRPAAPRLWPEKDTPNRQEDLDSSPDFLKDHSMPQIKPTQDLTCNVPRSLLG